MKTTPDYSSIREKRERNQRIKKGVTYALLGVWAVAVIFPFYWMLLTSFKDFGDYNAESVPQFITLNPTLENYIIQSKLGMIDTYWVYILPAIPSASARGLYSQEIPLYALLREIYFVKQLVVKRS